MRSLKWLLVCLVLLATDKAIILTVFSALVRNQQGPQPLQFGTYWNGVFYVVRYDQVTEQLVFDYLSKANCYFLKQNWMERKSGGFTSRGYVSLQLRLTDGTALPSGFDYYLTRDANQSLKLYPSNAPFLSSAADIRIFNVVSCSSTDNLANSITYWGSGPYSVLTASEDRILTPVGGVAELFCSSSHLVLYTYPSVTVTIDGDRGPIVPSGPGGTFGEPGEVASRPFGMTTIEGSIRYSGPSGPSGGSGARVARSVVGPQDLEDAKEPSRTNRSRSAFGGSVGITSPTIGQATSLAIEEPSGNVQLVIDYGSERRYVVLVAGSSAGMASYSRAYHDKSTVFRYQLYSTFSMTPQGDLVKVSSFTLRHRGTNRYLVANVSSTGELQAHSGMSGLILAPQSDFALGVDNQPDYRFFVQYSVRLPDGRSAQAFCSLFFRNYCLWPAATVKLSLRPVQTDHDLTTTTFTDPDKGALLSFYDRARRAAHSLSIPVLNFNQVTPPHGKWKSTGYESTSTHKKQHAT